MTIQINRHTDVKNHLAGIGIKVKKRNTTNVLVVKANGCETEFFFYKDGLYAGTDKIFVQTKGATKNES